MTNLWYGAPLASTCNNRQFDHGKEIAGLILIDDKRFENPALRKKMSRELPEVLRVMHFTKLEHNHFSRSSTNEETLG